MESARIAAAVACLGAIVLPAPLPARKAVSFMGAFQELHVHMSSHSGETCTAVRWCAEMAHVIDHWERVRTSCEERFSFPDAHLHAFQTLLYALMVKFKLSKV